MNPTILKLLFLFTLIPLQAFSQGSTKTKLLLFEVSALAGWGSSQLPSDANVPSIGTFTLGAAIGINVKKISIGVGYDYRTLTQYSDVDPTVGNRRGTFISPATVFLRLNFERIKFGLVLISSGTYELTNITSTGQKVIYTDPSIVRFDLIFKKQKRFTPLIYIETASFSGMQLDGVKSTLPANLTYTNFGAGIKYEY